MDGLLNLYKPTGITSAKALYRVRALTGQRKSGHAGTLDPAAEGVLILCLGKATKLVERLMTARKCYHAAARLDVTSSSFDSDRALEHVPIERIPSAAELHAVCAALIGRIQQIPPAVSALKVQGRPAYKLERAGKAVELAPRWVEVYALRVTRYEWPLLEFETECGRGTYIRALIRDIGAALHVGGCLSGLVRTAIGKFTAADAWTLEALREPGAPQRALISMERAQALLGEL